ncbi:Bug family tripartite tricarboxylate transporter substrate binding protein [Bordetella genomosp. 4]|uniref:MFS transporter n=1 Tax=Bordetella genomosp. 4 TaxID=463044 RepID=A0A261TRN7_9BORD|nr:tripartite tricarboxylate transporter substrate binding protein [Bordetella genomosp. 4]OZI52344.1 MFS transporter [Bordetella genomosp. 4]
MYKTLLLLLATAISGPLTPAAHAADWPDRPIRMVVPYPPGGATDVAARLYAQHMGDFLKQTVVVENKAGAGGEVGAEAVARATPDGYTVLMGALGSLAINASLLDKQNYSFVKDFKGVSVAITMPMALAVNTSVPANSVQELIALAKSRPGKLSMGSAGNGSSQHMAGELFKQITGTDILHVPYRGSGPAVTDLLGGQIDMVIDTLPALMPQLASGKIRILGVTTAERAPALPDVKTLAEQGVQGYAVATTYALLAPTGTPPQAIEKMSMAMQKAGALAQLRDGAAKLGAKATPTSPAETDNVISNELEKWAAVVHRSATRTAKK